MLNRIALTLLLCGCSRHPVATVAIGAGSVGLLTCEANNASFWRSHDVAHTQATCGIITAGAALFLGGLAALATHVAGADATTPAAEQGVRPGGVLRVRTHTPPPPVPRDSVPDQGSGVQPSRVQGSDAGVGPAGDAPSAAPR